MRYMVQTKFGRGRPRKCMTLVKDDDNLGYNMGYWREISNAEYLILKYAKGWKVEEWNDDKGKYEYVENNRRLK